MANFLEVQYQFAAHLRSPEHHKAPEGIEDRRMAIYRELFFNNIKSLLQSGFPITSSILPQTHWDQMVRHFFHNHACQTPYFLEVAQEFLAYLEDERENCETAKFDPDFLYELAHYEWVEVGLSTAEEEMPTTGVQPDGDLLKGVPMVSPLAWPLIYQYPVHQIGPEHLPEAPGQQPTCIIVYRRVDDTIGFMHTNPMTLRLLELLQERPSSSGEDTLRALAEQLQFADIDTLIQGGLQTLESFRSEGIVLGTHLSAVTQQDEPS